MQTHKFMIKEIFNIKKVYGKPIKTYKNGKVPYVTGTQSNNGVAGYIEASNDDISEGNCISIDPIKGYALYQPINFVGRGFSGASINLLYNNKLNKLNALYLCTLIERISKNVAAYTNLFNSNKLSDAEIDVPITPNPGIDYEYTVDDIDWNYMENYIKELETKHIKELETKHTKELEAYLSVTGLDDYHITDKDEEVLNKDVDMKEFKVGDLFTTQSGDTDLKKIDITDDGEILITSGIINNGIAGKTNKEAKIIPSNTLTIDMFGNVFYRDFEYKMVTHARVFALIPIRTINYREGLYIVGSLGFLTRLFSYNNMCSWNKIKDIVISLPVDENGEPDFEYMEKYIRAIEKQTIAKLYNNNELILKTAKEIVGD